MRILKPIMAPSGFMFLPIHFSQDVEGGKDDPEWERKMRSAFPRQTDWDQEMSIDFQMHTGSPAYPKYNDVKHLATEPVPYDDRRPLCLAMDFNTNPMSLIVGQTYTDKRLLTVIKEFVYGPTTIDAVINDFRNTFTSHRSDVVVYGDATSGMNAQTASSNWDVVRLAFRGYHVRPEFRLPLANPRIGDRLNAVNRLLQGDGPLTVTIDPSCKELIRDLREVILTPDGKKIFKETDPDNPYFFRTHASDALGYWIFREWPVVSEVIKMMSIPRNPIEPGRLLGEVFGGLKEEERLQQKYKQKRKPLDKKGSW